MGTFVTLTPAVCTHAFCPFPQSEKSSYVPVYNHLKYFVVVQLYTISKKAMNSRLTQTVLLTVHTTSM